MKAILLSLLAATSLVGGSAVANPIINQDQREIQQSNALTPAQLNPPQNGGTTTLRQKCEALQYFQNKYDWGGIIEMSFQIGFEHPIGRLSVDQACGKMGVNTYI